MDNSTKSRYDMILGRYPLTSLVLYLKCSNHAIEEGGGPVEICTAPMVDLGTHELKKIDTGRITTKEYFINASVYK